MTNKKLSFSISVLIIIMLIADIVTRQCLGKPFEVIYLVAVIGWCLIAFRKYADLISAFTDA